LAVVVLTRNSPVAPAMRVVTLATELILPVAGSIALTGVCFWLPWAPTNVMPKSVLSMTEP